MPLWGAFALIGIGLVAVFAEFFVPAFGLVGVGGLASIVAAVILTYRDHPDPWGMVMLITALVVTPTTLIIGFRRFPKSFIGRRLILTDTLGSPDGADGAGGADGVDEADGTGMPDGAGEANGRSAPDGNGGDGNAFSSSRNGLVGAEGTALTDLHPSGVAIVAERRLSVVTGGEYIAAGTEVVVTKVYGARIVVRDAREVR